MKTLNICSSFPSLICVFICLLFFACKKDVTNIDNSIIYPDFLINGVDIDQFGLDYPEDELEKYKNDSTKVCIVKVGERVSLKDISKKDENAGSRTWRLDEEDWKEVMNADKTFNEQVNFTFNEARYHKIGLSYGRRSFAVKLIRVVNNSSKVVKDSGETIVEDVVNNTPTKVKHIREEDDLFQQFPERMNFKLMFKNLFAANNSPSKKEMIFKTYKDSLAHFIVDESLIDVDGIGDDLIDVISMAIITGKSISLKSDPTYKDGKIAYMELTKN